MKIDWFTVIAQAINFLVLVWLLKKFLYKPVLNAIDEREKKITGQLKMRMIKKPLQQKNRMISTRRIQTSISRKKR